MNIDEEFRALIPTMTESNYKALEHKIVTENYSDPITESCNTIIDGYENYEICMKHNIPCHIISLNTFRSREETMEWIILNEFKKDNAVAYVRGLLCLRLEKINRKMSNPTFVLPDKTNWRSVTEMLASMAGIGHDTIDRVKLIEEVGTDEQKHDLLIGVKSLNKVYRQIHPLKEPKIKARKIPTITVEGEEELCTCLVCGVNKPLSRFLTQKGTCKECLNYLKRSNGNITRDDIRAMNGHIVNGVDTILQDMLHGRTATVKSDEENKVLVELNEVLNNFNLSLNKFLYMNSALKGTKDVGLLNKTKENIQKIINLMGE